MKIVIIAALIATLTLSAQARTSKDGIICSIAPSQNQVVSNVASAVGGGSAAVYTLTQASGLTAVAHSSGALLFTGSGGYVAGTLGGVAIAAPTIIGIGLAMGGAAITVELLCAPKNHPQEVAKVKEASKEFARRSKGLLKRSPKLLKAAKSKAIDLAATAKIKVMDVAGNALAYAYRDSTSSTAPQSN